MPRTGDSESETGQQAACNGCGGPIRVPPGGDPAEDGICPDCDGMGKAAYRDQLQRVTDTDE